ncbi:MAG TPA: hypothetical protein VF477_00305 [Mycobacterium sp.]
MFTSPVSPLNQRANQDNKMEVTLARCALRFSSLIVGAASMLVCPVAPPTAAAHTDDGSTNGGFTATSNEQWAMTNERYHDAAGVRSTWTISTMCTSPTECTGTMSSDQGWTADIYKRSGQWYVRHAISGWQPCPDGTAADGQQTLRFYEADPFTGLRSPGSDTYLGDDITLTASGACGINEPLVVKMPLKIVPA